MRHYRTVCFLLLCLAFLFAFGLLNYYLAQKWFCASCEFDDSGWFYRLFYRNDAAAGYHPGPTLLNGVALVGLSLGLAWLLARKTFVR